MSLVYKNVAKSGSNYDRKNAGLCPAKQSGRLLQYSNTADWDRKSVAFYSTAIQQAKDRIAVATGDMFVDWLTFFENTVERFRNPVDGRVSVPYGTEFSLAGINLVVME